MSSNREFSYFAAKRNDDNYGPVQYELTDYSIPSGPAPPLVFADDNGFLRVPDNPGGHCYPPPDFRPRRPGLATRVSWAAAEVWDNTVDELNITRVLYHVLSGVYLLLVLLLVYWLLPINGHWGSALAREHDRVPHSQALDLGNYFADFQGYSECNIRAKDLYQPLGQDVSHASHATYCTRRKDLLEAMSSGGRIGFDSPFFPRDCHYRWYTVPEICMILSRFQAVVFIGDSSLQTVYAGLNVLLRQDLSHGALKTWDMENDKDILCQCNCDLQFTSTVCASHFITSSTELSIAHTSGKVSTPYLCSQTPHAFLHITTSPAPDSVLAAFNTLVPMTKRSNYHPIPIIHSLSPSSSPLSTVTASLEEFLALADQSHRKTPMLWLGPTASGHTEIRGRKGNQEIWDFDHQMRTVAEDNGVEVLGMWNMSVQAGSWDGVRFGEKVAITQAMMVVNWLARLESS